MVEFTPNTRTDERVRPTEEERRQYREAPYRPEGRARFEHDERTILELVRDIADEGRLLVRQEVQLFRTEMMEKGRAAARHSAMIAAGGAIAYAGLLAIIAALTAGVYTLMVVGGVGWDISLWLAPLIVGLVVAIIGYAMYKSAMNRLRKDDMVPRRTAETMKENAAWMQERATR